MFSVDISESHIAIAEKASTPATFLENLHFILQDSVEFLGNFEGAIDFLYLDSYDYDEKNPGPPQQHCLNEIVAASCKLHDGSVVMIDDCNIPGGGKGSWPSSGFWRGGG